LFFRFEELLKFVLLITKNTVVKKALIFLVLANVSVLFAQSNLRLGVNLDPMASWLSPKTNRIDKDGARPGIAGGLMLEYYFRPNYGLVTGFNLGVQGGNVLYNDSVNISTGDHSKVGLKAGSTVAYSLSYITIPLGLKMKTNEIGYFTYFAELGLTHQINIGSRATSTGSGLNKDNVPKETNVFNMSYFFGGGVEYNIGGQTSIIAGLFFNNGFVDVLSNNDHKAVLNYLTVRLGVLF
jgi:hypothetical protein